uniref:UAS domain-containing protein n=1 Tax=Syphacia muris TaxID=451379 RepID=A0A0N5AAS5_9BILA
MEALDDTQAEKLQQFQEITNIKDVDIAVGTLASLDWDVQKAIDVHMTASMDSDNNDSPVLVDKHFDEFGGNGDLCFTGSTSDNRVHLNAGGSSIRRKGSIKGVNAKSNALKRINLGDSSSAGASSSVLPSDSSHIESESKTAATVRVDSYASNLDMSSDDDHDDLDYQDFGEDDIEEPSFRQESDDVPLVPTDFSSVPEAINNFTTVFESRYSASHPVFFAGELKDAAREAFDAPRRPVAERKPLAIYLHHDKSVASYIFSKDVLCSSSVSSLLKRQFVLWAWDITQCENKNKFLEWIDQLGVRDFKNTVERTQIDRFPLLAVFVKDKGVIETYDIAYGFEAQSLVVDKLVNGLDNYQRIKNVDAALEKERQEREQILEEQAIAYEKSLAADRARVERLERERQQQMEEEAARLMAKQTKLNNEAKLAASLPPEPSANESNIAFVRIRFPRNSDDGSQKVEMRRFRMSEPLRNLATFIESKGYSLDEHRIWTSDFPKKDMVASYDLDRSFGDLRWPVREQVIVDEK